MVTILLQKILDLLEAHFPGVITLLSKLNLIEEDTEEMRANVDSMKTTLEDVDEQTTAAAGSLNQINTTATSINGNVAVIKNNSEAIKNNVMSMSTNVGNISAYSEATANNTLDIDEKITSIASDTTQIRTNSNSIALNVGKIVEDLEYYFLNNFVTEEVIDALCNFDTDLEDYLQACKVNIPADQTGFSGITITKNGKNLLDKNNVVTGYITSTGFSSGNTNARTFYCKIKPNTTYTVSHTLTARFIIATAVNQPLNGELFTNRQTNNNAEVLTITSGASDNYLWVFCYLNGTDTKTYDEIANSIMAEVGLLNTTYEPYKAMTYPVSFGTTITDGAEINLLDGIIKVNNTPVSYLSITPIAVRTYK